jgi:hypothetical protein
MTMLTTVDLPFDVVKKILEYDGSMKYRHGRFMTQIPKTDLRYPILRTIPRKLVTKYGTSLVELSIKDSLIVFDESYIGLNEVIYKIYYYGFPVELYTHILR